MLGLQDVKGFLSDKFNLYLVLGLLFIGAYLLFVQAQPAPQEYYHFEGQVRMDFFYLPTCPHCHDQMKFHEGLKERYANLTIVMHDVTVPTEQLLLIQKLNEKGQMSDEIQTPTTFIGDNVFIGFSEETGRQIEEAVIANGKLVAGNAGGQEQKFTVSVPFIGEVYLLNYSLPVITIILGLVDGFNPCAMWVLVYLIALVMEMGDRRRIWLIVGTFVLASGILYFLFMTAWLNAFLFLGYVRAVTVLIGLVALGGGILSVREYAKMKGPLVCDVASPEEKKSTMQRARLLVSAPLTIATFIGIIALAFAVNAIEFVCSAALPAIFAQILAISNLSALERYAYIALYVFFFMLDDLIIFGLAAFAVGNISVGEKYAKLSRIVGGVLLLVLGFMLLFMPYALR